VCPTSLLAAQLAIIPQVYRVAQIHSTGFVLHQSAALCVFLHCMYRSRQARIRRGGCEALGRRRAGQLPCGQHPPSNMCGVWPYSLHSITYVVTLLFDSQGSIPADCFRSLGGSSRTSGGPMTGHAQAHGPLFPPACSRSWLVPTLLALVTVCFFQFIAYRIWVWAAFPGCQTRFSGRLGRSTLFYTAAVLQVRRRRLLPRSASS
jgi:hypothetical protein